MPHVLIKYYILGARHFDTGNFRFDLFPEYIFQGKNGYPLIDQMVKGVI